MLSLEFKEQVGYLFYTLFHPFDGFYEIKHRQKGNMKLAVTIFILFGMIQCFAYQYTGFIINVNPLFSMNSVAIFVSSLSVFLLFSVSNWTITTLFNGKGKLKEIFLVICYALLPLTLAQLFLALASNVAILEEVIILRSVVMMGAAWFVFTALAGLCVIHEYSFTKNIQTLFATAAAALIIIFIGLLFFTLLERMIEFVTSVGQEFMRRIY